jgi:hypothetical protein
MIYFTIITLIITIWITFINLVNTIRGHTIPALHIFIMAASWVAIAYTQGYIN